MADGDNPGGSDPLPNARHERFAQALASGMSATAAYGAAGFKPGRNAERNASRLKGNEGIAARMAHIMAKAAERVVSRISVDRRWVIDRLVVSAMSALRDGQYAPANRALELLGKEVAGMFVDNKRVSIEVDQELQAFLTSLRTRLDPDAYERVLRAAAEAKGATLAN